MGRHKAPGPVYVGRFRRWLLRHASWLGIAWWLCLEPRKNDKKAKPQQVKSQGRKNSVKSRGGGGWFSGGDKKDDGKKKGWFS